MSTAISKPTLESVLTALSRERLYDLGRVGAGLRESKAPKIVEKAGPSLSMVFLALHGSRALLVRQRGQRVETQYFVSERLPFPARYILADFHRVFLRGFGGAPRPDGVHRVSAEAPAPSKGPSATSSPYAWTAPECAGVANAPNCCSTFDVSSSAASGMPSKTTLPHATESRYMLSRFPLPRMPKPHEIQDLHPPPVPVAYPPN